MSDYLKYRQRLKLGLVQPKEKEQKNIPKVSPKQAKLNREYSAKAKAFLAARKICEIQSPECTQKATEVHHVKGRIGALLMEEKYFIASCHNCNQYVESHDAWARQKGFKKSKHG